jgi:hypothetical protein
MFVSFMTTRITAAGRRSILTVAAALVAYALVIVITGGFVVETPWGDVTSRAAIRPFIAAGLILLFYRVHLAQHWHSDIAPLARVPWPPAIAASAAITAVVVGSVFGTTIAGGPDASGYVSQAAMLARGELALSPPAWLAGATWPGAALSAAAVGYTPSPDATRLVPTYSPGLPLIMAAIQLAAGPAAVLYVVPILGGVAVWATWLIGKALGDQSAGAIAAVLMLVSPIFLLLLLTPMSDVPAAAFWALSLAASLRGRSAWAGLAASIAILIRPNTVALAAVPLLVLLTHGSGRVIRTMVFAAATVPAAAAIGALLWHYYGSPLHSGYGSAGALFGFDRVAVNATQYARWFVDSHTALPLIGLIAPAVHPNTPARVRAFLVLTVFPCAVLALYLLYEFVIPADAWAYLRFLIPALPLLMVGMAIVVLKIWRRAEKWFVVGVACVILVGWAAVHALQYGRDTRVFGFKASDQRYARAVAYAQSLPQNSVLVSLGHSGPLRFYAGRDVLRFDALDGDAIDAAVAYLEARGHKVFFVGDPFEVGSFKQRFAGTNTLRRLEIAPPTDLGGAVAYVLSRD